MKKIVLILFLISLSNIYSQKYYTKRYSTFDGLLQNTIRAIIQDDLGRLWLGTSEGLSIYDGTDFTNYDKKDGMSGSVINCFFKFDSTTMWVSVVNGGISIFHKSKFEDDKVIKVLKGEKYFLDDRINAIFKDSKGRMWFCTDSGITVWSNSDYTKASVHHFNDRNDPFKMFVYSVSEDRNGNIWFGSDHGLIKYNNHSFKFIKGLPKIVNVVKAYDGKIWLGTNKGVFVFQNGMFKRLFKNKHIYSSEVNDIFKDKKGDIWFSTTEGLYFFNGEKLTNFNTQDRIGNKFVLSFLIGKNKNIWVGTEDGLDKISSKDLYYIDAKYKYSYLWQLTSVANNIIYATTKDGVYKIVKNKLVYAEINSELPSKTVTRLLFDNNRIKWAATSNGLVEFYPNGKKRIFTKEDGFDSNYILSLAKGGKDSVWVGTKGYWENPRGRVYLITEDRVIQPQPLKELAPDPVTTLFIDSNNNLWIGFFGKGLYQLKGNKLSLFSSKDKLPSFNIRNAFEDKKGNLWFMTRYKGVFKLSGNKFINYTIKNGLSSNWVLAATEDNYGNIWFNTARGVCSYNGKDFLKLTYGGPLMSGEMWASTTGKCGNVWFANASYIFTLNPKSIHKKTFAANLYIEKVLINDSHPPNIFYSNGTLNYNENTIEFFFNRVNYSEGLETVYRYKLNGLTKKWSTLSNRNYVKFHNLPAGKYKFLVSAKIPGQKWSKVNTDVSFLIVAPFWQEKWFVILLGLFIISFILLITYLVDRYKINQLLKIYNMRLHIASDLHDDIGANLTSISILSELAKNKMNLSPKISESYLEKIGNNARQIIDSMSDIVWLINPETDSLNKLLEKMESIALEILGGKGITVDYKWNKKIDNIVLSMNVRKNLLLIFKESINNIAKYSSATFVKIYFNLSELDKTMIVEINDNGKGFDTSRNYEGNGMKNIKKRASYTLALLI